AVVGGGQLARMMQQAAIGLGVHVRALVEAADTSAAQVVPDAPVGRASDEGAVRALLDGADVLTFEHAHVPRDLLRPLGADGVALRPGPAAPAHAEDTGGLPRRLPARGAPGPGWAAAADADARHRFGADVGWPVVVKTARGGYGGKGVRVVRAAEEAA